jgi:hypothetical protein
MVALSGRVAPGKLRALIWVGSFTLILLGSGCTSLEEFVQKGGFRFSRDPPGV